MNWNRWRKAGTLASHLFLMSCGGLFAQDDENDGESDPYERSTPLIDAVKSDNIALISSLLAQGASPNEEVAAGPPLVWAKSASAVQSLVAAGADPNGTGQGGTMSILVLQLQARGNAAVVHALLAAGAHPIGGALLTAANLGDAAEVKELVRAGAPMEARDDQGLTPLLMAASHNHDQEVLQALVKSGARLEAVNDEGQNALMLSVTGRNTLEVSTYLCPVTKDHQHRDSQGRDVPTLIQMYRNDTPQAFLKVWSFHND